MAQTPTGYTKYIYVTFMAERLPGISHHHGPSDLFPQCWEFYMPGIVSDCGIGSCTYEVT